MQDALIPTFMRSQCEKIPFGKAKSEFCEVFIFWIKHTVFQKWQEHWEKQLRPHKHTASYISMQLKLKEPTVEKTEHTALP